MRVIEADLVKTVIKLVASVRQCLFSVVGLYKDSEVLLLIIYDLSLACKFLSPKKHVDKIYQAKVDGIMDQEDILAFEKGIELKDHTCQPAKLEIVSVDRDAGTSLVQITIAEGKFHQVKRMVAACGKEVIELQRMSMGPLSLPDDLELGAWRRLTEEELEALAVFGIPLA